MIKSKIISSLIFAICLLVPYTLVSQENSVKKSEIIETYKGKQYFMHFVKEGETLKDISQAYLVSVEDIKRDNNFIDKEVVVHMVLRIIKNEQNSVKKTHNITISTPELNGVTADTLKSYIIYKVERKDSFQGIARKFKITEEELLKANPNLKRLKKGILINIPTPKKQTYEIQIKPTIDTSYIEIPNVDVLNDIDSISDEFIIVKPKQTLFRIANENNISIDSLIILNPELKDGLKAGMVLRIKHKEKVVTNYINLNQVDINKNLEFQNSPFFDLDNLKKEYKVALLMPFNTENFVYRSSESLDPKSDFYKFYQFYAGFLLSVENLVEKGLKIKLYVFDAESEAGTTKIENTLKNKAFKDMNMIIGPLFIHNFNVVAEYAQKNKIPIINPFSKRNNIITDNEYVFKTNNIEFSLAPNIVKHINSNFSKANIILIDVNDKDFEETYNYLSNIYENNQSNFKLAKVNYSDGGVSSVVSALKSDEDNIVLFLTNDNQKIKNFLTLFNSRSRSYNVNVIGFNDWENVNVETQYLTRFNYTQISSYLVNNNSEKIQEFKNQFRNKYKFLPLKNEFSYYGYDLGTYFLSSLMYFGNKNVDSFSKVFFKGISTNFYFEKAGNGHGYSNYGTKLLKLSNNELIEE